jgi:hypothetical protein
VVSPLFDTLPLCIHMFCECQHQLTCTHNCVTPECASDTLQFCAQNCAESQNVQNPRTARIRVLRVGVRTPRVGGARIAGIGSSGKGSQTLPEQAPKHLRIRCENPTLTPSLEGIRPPLTGGFSTPRQGGWRHTKQYIIWPG